MDYLEFVARSEWPVVVGATLFILRGRLGRMLDRVNFTKLDIWGVKAEFEKVLDKVDLLAPPVEVKGETVLSSSSASVRVRTNDAASEAIAQATQQTHDASSPDLVILMSWRQFEEKVRMLSPAAMQLRPFGPRVPFPLEISARNLGLDDDEVSALIELRNLRNQVAHNSNVPITDAEADRFKAATQRLLARMVESSQKGSASKQSKTSINP